jgi:hypothetical protein
MSGNGSVNMPSKSSFDLDFSYGRKGELLVEELLTDGKKVEVKRDRKWHLTGNVYIETECFFTKNNAWAPSGLSVTEAEYWAFVLKRTVVMLPLDVVWYAVKTFGRDITCEIPPNISKGYLVKVVDLIEATKQVSVGQGEGSTESKKTPALE